MEANQESEKLSQYFLCWQFKPRYISSVRYDILFSMKILPSKCNKVLKRYNNVILTE